jgi:DNA replication protein DnaC
MKTLGETARDLGMVEETGETDCYRHGRYTRKRYRFGGRWMDWTRCPGCAAEADTERQAADSRALALRRLEAAGVPLRFMGKRFEDYRVDTQAQRAAVATATGYAENFATHHAEGRCLIFVGQPGTGKTHLAIAILKQAMAAGFSGRYVRAFELIEAIRATWRRDSDQREAEVLETFTRVDLLVLDEIGVQYGTEAETVEIFKVLDTRYLDLKPTLLVSNVSRADLERYLGPRAFDRLRESGGVLAGFDWPSERGAI